jgi:hypothetical protein
MHTPRLPLLLAAGACAAALAPAAHADTLVSATYDATFTGTYHLSATEGDPGAMSATRTVDLTWNATTAQALELTPTPSADTAVSETDPPQVSLTGAYHEQIESDPPSTQDCTLSVSSAPTPGIVGASTDESGTITVDVEPFGTVGTSYACSRPISDPGMAFLGHDFAAHFTIPAGRLGEATIVVPVSSAATLPCPSYGLTLSCDVSWTGQVTLTRRGTVTEGPAPAPVTQGGGSPAAGAPAPARGSAPPAPRPAPPEKDPVEEMEIPPLVPLGHGPTRTPAPPLLPADHDPGVPWIAPAHDMTWDPEHGVLDFYAACADGCDGTASVTPAAAGMSGHLSDGRSAKGQSRQIRLSVPASRHAGRVSLRLPRAARRAVGRSGRGVLILTLRDRASHETTAVRLLLRARGAGRRGAGPR